MKKILVLVFAAAILAAPRAQAQDSMMFNHMALGATIGIDGFGIDAVMPVGEKFQLRAGYAIDPIVVNTKLDLGSFSAQGKIVNLNGIPLKAQNWKSGTGHLMADFYPNKGGLHISLGMFVNNGKLLSASANLTSVLSREDWGTLSVGPEGGFKVSTDKEGMLNFDVKNWVVMPYLGFGFGRALNPEKTFGFVFDMGLMVWGSLQIQSYDYTDNSFNSAKPVKTVTIDAKSVESFSSQAATIVDAVASLPVAPYLRFGFYFKLF